MNENIDLTKILYGCPKGIEFYSSIYGVVEFDGFDFVNEPAHPIRLKTNSGYCQIAKDGRALIRYNGECTFFPSKYIRDWSKFERFWDKPKIEKFDPRTLQPFDKVLVRDINTSNWYVDFFSDFNNQGEFVCIGGCHWVMGIPYNEETKHLVGTTKYCSEYYKWWEE